MWLAVAISFILALLILRGTYIKAREWDFDAHKYTEWEYRKVKSPIWFYILALFVVFIPVANIVSTVGITLAIMANLKNEIGLRKEEVLCFKWFDWDNIKQSEFVKFLNKEI